MHPPSSNEPRDILAVMDAAGLDRPSVVGASEGGLMAQLFAAQHPERVDRLVLLNTHPGRSGMIAVHRDPDGSLDRLERLGDVFDRVVDTWGSDPQYSVDRFCPSNSDNAAFVRWYGRLERSRPRTPTSGARSTASSTSMPPRRWPRSRHRRCVLHATGDPLMPVAGGRYIAERIPGARFVEIPGIDHFVEPTPTGRSSPTPGSSSSPAHGHCARPNARS